MNDPVPQLVDHLFRQQAGRMVSHLVRVLGAAHVDLAEDVVQEALVVALRRWPFTGVPDDPAAWLVQVARNRAIDVLRRHANLRDKLAELRAWGASTAERDETRFGDELDDDSLRMIFACSHPAIAADARGPLTLKLAGGFGVAEIARAFLSREPAIAQRIVRAKRRLRAGDVALEVPAPAELPARLDSVLEVLYLMFNEGYAAHRGERLVRADLVDEAIRLGRLVAAHPVTGVPRAHALLALMLLQGARLPARVDAGGRLLLLAEQDRSLWDRRRITAGFRHLERAAEGHELSEYHVQAAIAACHLSAASADTTDWPQILTHYEVLARHFPSPVVALNRAVAMAMVDGPEHGLAALEPLAELPELDDYYLLPATRGELLRRSGRDREARAEFQCALDLVSTEPERRFLQARLASVGAAPGGRPRQYETQTRRGGPPRPPSGGRP